MHIRKFILFSSYMILIGFLLFLCLVEELIHHMSDDRY